MGTWIPAVRDAFPLTCQLAGDPELCVYVRTRKEKLHSGVLGAYSTSAFAFYCIFLGVSGPHRHGCNMLILRINQLCRVWTNT